MKAVWNLGLLNVVAAFVCLVEGIDALTDPTVGLGWVITFGGLMLANIWFAIWNYRRTV